MPKFSPALIVPVLVGAGLIAYLIPRRNAPTAAVPVAATTPSAEAVPMADPVNGVLPANHFDVPGIPRAQHATATLPNADNEKPAAIDWKVPATWKTLKNVSPMRLATYGVTDSIELSVMRAGGSVDANVLRWSQQFEGTPQPERSEKEVNGLHVTTVRIAGTFGGGMMGPTGADKRDNWAMLAAVVEAPGAPYFFKMVGPAKDIDKARADFNELVGSVTPKVPVPPRIAPVARAGNPAPAPAH